jgi:hypothetical protein
MIFSRISGLRISARFSLMRASGSDPSTAVIVYAGFGRAGASERLLTMDRNTQKRRASCADVETFDVVMFVCGYFCWVGGGGVAGFRIVLFSNWRGIAQDA